MLAQVAAESNGWTNALIIGASVAMAAVKYSDWKTFAAIKAENAKMVTLVAGIPTAVALQVYESLDKIHDRLSQHAARLTAVEIHCATVHGFPLGPHQQAHQAQMSPPGGTPAWREPNEMGS